MVMLGRWAHFASVQAICMVLGDEGGCRMVTLAGKVYLASI